MHKYMRHIEAQMEKSSGLYCFYSFFFWLVVVAVELLFQFGCGRIGDIWVAFERVRKNLSTRYGFENISKTHGSV